MLNFQFIRTDVGEVTGFDMGDITITGDLGIVTTCGDAPCMIFIAASDLLFGVRQLLFGRSGTRYSFVATDSSFSVSFELCPKGDIRVSSNRFGEIHKATREELVRVIGHDIREFAAGYPIPDAEGGIEDLKASLSNWEIAFK